MLRRNTVENRLREAGYKYDDENKTTRRWRKPGTTLFVYVHKGTYLREEAVKSILAQIGLKSAEVDRFVAEHTCSPSS